MIPACSNCRFFQQDEFEEDPIPPDTLDPAKEESGEEEKEEEPESGTCHRHAPQPTLFCFLPQREWPPTIQPTSAEDAEEIFEGPDTTTIWPAVDAGDFCGEWKNAGKK
jgi:hypothetical protein